MVRFRTSLFIIAIFAIAIALIFINSIEKPEVDNIENGNSPISNTSSEETHVGNVSVIPGESFEESLILPPQDHFLNNMEWSNYSLLRNPRIHSYEVSYPTYVIDHEFLYVVLVAEINNESDPTEILSQLSGIVLEERKLLGPNSAPSIWGTVDSIWVYNAAMLPYDDKIILNNMR